MAQGQASFCEGADVRPPPAVVLYRYSGLLPFHRMDLIHASVCGIWDWSLPKGGYFITKYFQFPNYSLKPVLKSDFKRAVGPLCPWVLHPSIQPTVDQKIESLVLFPTLRLSQLPRRSHERTQWIDECKDRHFQMWWALYWDSGEKKCVSTWCWWVWGRGLLTARGTSGGRRMKAMVPW